MGIDEETRYRNHLKWARICVKMSDEIPPANLELFVDNLKFTIPLWVESSSWVEEIDRSLVESRWNIPQKLQSRVTEACLSKEDVGESLDTRATIIKRGHGAKKGKEVIRDVEAGPSVLKESLKKIGQTLLK